MAQTRKMKMLHSSIYWAAGRQKLNIKRKTKLKGKTAEGEGLP
jgi:hypothetical protein